MDLFDPPQRRMMLELTLDTSLVDQARHHRINVSQAAEEGLRRALAEAWRGENAQAIKHGNLWLRTHGTPLGERF